MFEDKSETAIEVLRSWLDFSEKREENREIKETIEFLEKVSKYSYGEIIKKLKIVS